MIHFWMELNAPCLFAINLVGCNCHLVGRGYYVKAFGKRRNCVAMAHPHLGALVKPVH